MIKYNLLTSVGVAALSIALAASPVHAQDGFDLGVLILGKNKRKVQTDTATPITEIGQEEINDRQAGTIAQLVDSVPGVSLVNGSTPQGSGINIRGFGANSTYGTDQKVAIIADGATLGGEELYRIGTQLFTDPALYKSVSVIRGTVGSFEYGTGIIGGVVKLDTKDASDFLSEGDSFAVRQTLQFSTNAKGLSYSTILVGRPAANLEVLFNYTGRKLDPYKDGNGNQIGQNEIDVPSWLLKAKLAFGEAGDQSLTFSYSDTQSDDRDVPYNSFSGATDVFGNVDRQTYSKTASLTYRWNPATTDMIDLEAILSYADQEIFSEGVSGQTGFLGALVNADHRYETTKLTLKNTSLFSTGAVEHNLKAGLEYIHKKRLNASSAPGGTDNRFAVFMIDELELGNGFSLTPALRWETSKIQGSTAPNDGVFRTTALVGGISARYALQNGWSIFGSAAYTENLPILDDLGSPIFREQPEKSTTFEIGTAFERADVFNTGDSLSFKATAYKSRLWDVTSFFQISEIETKGIELEAAYSAESGFYLDMNATVGSGRRNNLRSGIGRFAGIPAHSLQLVLGKKFGKEYDVSWEVIAAKRYTNFSGRTPIVRKGFGVHNFRVTYKPQSGALKGLEARFGVENVFDKQFQPSLSTRAAPGRNFKITLAKTF